MQVCMCNPHSSFKVCRTYQHTSLPMNGLHTCVLQSKTSHSHKKMRLFHFLCYCALLDSGSHNHGYHKGLIHEKLLSYSYKFNSETKCSTANISVRHTERLKTTSKVLHLPKSLYGQRLSGRSCYLHSLRKYQSQHQHLCTLSCYRIGI